jgi:hypothetical protein
MDCHAWNSGIGGVGNRASKFESRGAPLTARRACSVSSTHPTPRAKIPLQRGFCSAGQTGRGERFGRRPEGQNGGAALGQGEGSAGVEGGARGSSSARRAWVAAGVGTRACTRPWAKRKAKKWTGVMVPGGATPSWRRRRGRHEDDRAMHARTTELRARGRWNHAHEDTTELRA